MKKVFLILALIVFSFFLTPAFAEETVEESTIATDTPKVEKANYNLPYPGLLPGNPLYNLKALRDRVVAILISDPLKKTEFDVLASDKRLNAGIFLLERKKEDLAIDTISKSNNYFDDALVNIKRAKKMGGDIKPLLERMKQSIKKHQEVAGPYEKRISSGNKSAFSQELFRMKKFENSVKKLFEKE